MPHPNTQNIWSEISQIDWCIPPKLALPLKKKTSVGVGGSADIFIQVSTMGELSRLLEMIRSFSYPWMIIGNGSNLLVRDSGFPGAVIRLKGDFGHIETVGNASVISGTGIPNTKLSNFCQKHALAGLEFLFTIPGTLGGAIYMNAGAYGSEIKDHIEWVEILDKKGRIQKLDQKRCDFNYRSSTFKSKDGILLRAKLSLTPGKEEDIKKTKEGYAKHRREVQPTQIKTWGSVFLNPEGMSAGKMIEACGLKGKGVGDAVINTKHANFIENKGDATFKDLQETITMAQKAVKSKYGIDLIAEGEIIPNKCNQ